MAALQLRYVSVLAVPTGLVSRFEDGTSWGAETHDVGHYHYLAWAYGHQGDLVAYCRAHELCHHLIAEAFGQASPVIWALAHGERPGPMVAAAEEALAHVLHRLAFTGAPALIEGLCWDDLAAGVRHGLKELDDAAQEG